MENKLVGVKGDEGGPELSRALVQSLQREQLERQAAALATSGAPLAWPGARPRQQDSGRRPFRTMGRRSAKAAPQTAIFSAGLARVCLNWEVKHAKAEREAEAT